MKHHYKQRYDVSLSVKQNEQYFADMMASELRMHSQQDLATEIVLGLQTKTVDDICNELNSYFEKQNKKKYSHEVVQHLYNLQKQLTDESLQNENFVAHYLQAVVNVERLCNQKRLHV